MLINIGLCSSPTLWKRKERISSAPGGSSYLVQAPSHTFSACCSSFLADFTTCTFSCSLLCSDTTGLHLTMCTSCCSPVLEGALMFLYSYVSGYLLAVLQNSYIPSLIVILACWDSAQANINNLLSFFNLIDAASLSWLQHTRYFCLWNGG